MTRRTIAVLLVAIVIAVAAEAGFGAHIVHTDHAVGTQRTSLAQTRSDVAKLGASVSVAKRVLATTNRAVVRRSQEQQHAQAALSNARKLLTSGKGQLAYAGRLAAQASAAVAGLQACVAATTASTAARQFGDSVKAISILRDAGSSCEDRIAAGDPDPAVFPFDFADPSVLRVGDTYYAYSTNAALGNVQLIASMDLVHWLIVGDALPQLPAWALPGATWAPAVAYIDGKYVAFYTVRSATLPAQCISVAVAAQPIGPFVDTSKQPLLCQVDRGGSVDPRPFVDTSGHATLVWKSERSGGFPAQIWSQPLAAGGTALTGTATVLISADRRWEAGVVEAPALVDAGGVLALFYSGGEWNSDSYALGEARCASPAGPCQKVAAPVLTGRGSIASPGSADFVSAPDGRLWMVYSAFRAPHIGYPDSRLLHIARVNLDPKSVSFSPR